MNRNRNRKRSTTSKILTINVFSYEFRGLFIIDHRGVLRQITMNDLPVGRSVDETLRLVQAFQYTDSHGEVCPAGWKPGSDTVCLIYLGHFTILYLIHECEGYLTTF